MRSSISVTSFVHTTLYAACDLKASRMAWNWPKHLVQSDLCIAQRQRNSCVSMFQRHILNSFCRGLGRSWVLWLASLAWNLPCPCCVPDVLPSVSRTCKQCSAELCARNCVVNAAWRELLEYIGVLESTRDTLKILWSYSENVQAFERFRARAQSARLQSSTVIARWQADEWSVPWQRSHCSRAVWPGCRDMWWQIGPTTVRIIPNIYIVYQNVHVYNKQ